MLKAGEPVIIDFQDALLGPRQYDLVSFLRDSYIELDWRFLERMVDRYIDAFEREIGERFPPEPFKQLFDLRTVQRKVKAAAPSEHIPQGNGKPNFSTAISSWH